MIKFIMTCIFALAIIRQSVLAQDYELVQPTIEEYFLAIPDIVLKKDSESVKEIIGFEMMERFPTFQEVPFDQLYATYHTLDVDYLSFVQARPFWNQWVILTWMDSNDIDLSMTHHFEFEVYTVDVKPYDFNEDDQMEWFLNIKSDNYSQFVVISGTPHHYRVINSPLPSFSTNAWWTSVAAGFMEELNFADLNHDGLPEWVLAVGGLSGNNLSSGYLYVLQWQADQLINLAPLDQGDEGMGYKAPAGGGRFPLFPYGVSVEMRDVDNNFTQEIIIHQLQTDNWGCQWTLNRTFGWENSVYSLKDITRVEDILQGCEIRKAEEAMWVRDYSTAILHYELALQLPALDDYFVDEIELSRYATARLALAYTMVGQHTDALQTIELLRQQQDENPVLQNYINAVKSNLGNATETCAATYDVFKFECPQNTDACLGSPLNSIVGYTIENFGDEPHSPRHAFPQPEYAGCMLESIVLTATPSTTYPNPIPPSDTLDYVANPSYAKNDALQAINSHNFMQALDIVNQALTTVSPNEDLYYKLGYIRALALEENHQPEEALDQYIAILEESPDSAWGLLAALHTIKIDSP